MNSFWARYACVTPAPFFCVWIFSHDIRKYQGQTFKSKNWSENTAERFYLDQYLLNVVEVLLKKIISIVEQDLLHI